MDILKFLVFFSIARLKHKTEWRQNLHAFAVGACQVGNYYRALCAACPYIWLDIWVVPLGT
jgi:hypothetical protein